MNKRRYIEVYDRYGDLLRRFPGVRYAAEFTGFPETDIYTALRDGTEYNGFFWKHKN